MAVAITFWNLEKRINSTARPGSAGTVLSGTIKSPCSVLEPSIELNFDPTDYNYFRITEWDRFYFVTDMVYEDGIWTVRGRVDPLASFKDYIGNSYQYVLRSASSGNTEIMDNYYPAKANGHIKSAQVGMSMNNLGTFVVGVCGYGASGTTGGGTTYYELTPSQMSSLVQWLYTDTNYISGTAIDDTDKFYFNPLQYIVSVIWYPFSWTGDSEQSTTIRIGWWNTGITANKASVSHLLGPYTLSISGGTIPVHPLAATQGAYLRSEPFSKYRLSLPGAGEIVLNGPVMAQISEINIVGFVDTITGKIFYNVYAGSVSTSNLMSRLEGNIGVSIALSQVSVNTIGAAMYTYSYAAKSVVTAGVGAAGAFGDAMEAMTPTVSRTGSDGSRSMAVTNSNIIIVLEYITTVSIDVEDFGMPLSARMQISSLHGFTLCQSPHIAINGTRREAEEIEQFMEGGFFYE